MTQLNRNEATIGGGPEPVRDVVDHPNLEQVEGGASPLEETTDHQKHLEHVAKHPPSSSSDILRLFKLIFLRKDFCESFTKESFPNKPNELSKSNFWQSQELLEAFQNDETVDCLGVKNVTTVCDDDDDDDDKDDKDRNKRQQESIQRVDTPRSPARNKVTNQDLLSWYRDVERAASQSFADLSSALEGEKDIATVDASSRMASWQEVDVLEPVMDGSKKVLVTGGAGFIGSHVADFLLARGDNVVIVDEVNDYYDVNIKESNLKLLTDKYGVERVKIYRGDVCDETLLTRVFETEQPQWICHMAARAGVRPSIDEPYVYIHSNVKATTLLMDFSVKYKVQNFVFASSSSVYGESKSSFFSEEDVVDNPVSPYAATKKACELLAYTYHHLYKLPVTGLRFFTVYGPRGRPDMAPFKFIEKCRKGETIQQFGDGTSSRDYTYIDDIVNGVVRAIDRPYPYQIFNLGKGKGTSLKDFLTMVEKYVGKPLEIEVLPDQPGDVPYTCANVSKAARLLGYKSQVPFDEGIQRTVEWHKLYKEQE